MRDAAATTTAVPPARGQPEAHEGRLSWEEVTERYRGVVFGMAYTLTSDPHDASDLTQDVFLRVYRSLDRYRPGNFEGWLYRITRNLFLDGVRRRTRLPCVTLPVDGWREPPEPAPGPAERAEQHVLRSDLLRALLQLPPQFRTAVVLVDVEGATYAEVAESLGWPLGTVRSRVHRGRKAVREAMQARIDGPEDPRASPGPCPSVRPAHVGSSPTTLASSRRSDP